MVDVKVLHERLARSRRLLASIMDPALEERVRVQIHDLEAQIHTLGESEATAEIERRTIRHAVATDKNDCPGTRSAISPELWEMLQTGCAT